MQDNTMLLDTEELIALSRSALLKEDYDCALTKLKLVVRQEQFPIEVYSLLGRVYAALELFDKSVAAFQEFLTRRPEVVPERFHLGMVYRNMGENTKAIQVWDEVLEQAPMFPPALYNKGLYYLDEGNKEEAIELFNYIIDHVDPDDSHVEMANYMLSSMSLSA
ncbi:tetratricopeptide repeat protein [Vibrio sp. MEBiC08052]|uniref:tetratricopeptide repeat protein n=1 Tax=Vibrio sp. MEBiC08052 TaxID=1761910 RepID=UPI0007405B3F|nr:tetratricopeptide repeat protein [Vibrio sp. MEBiC08052]KUI97005.1 hypothetical protein VRK_38600 [Vibrio sp. MEBiC08052]